MYIYKLVNEACSLNLFGKKISNLFHKVKKKFVARSVHKSVTRNIKLGRPLYSYFPLPSPGPKFTPNEDESNVIITASGRRKVKRHQCFCGAWFTRADNLKRHIRKCHEEKLEKLPRLELMVEAGEDGDGGGQSGGGGPGDGMAEFPPNIFSDPSPDGQQQLHQQQPHDLVEGKDVHDDQQLQQPQHFLSESNQSQNHPPLMQLRAVEHPLDEHQQQQQQQQQHHELQQQHQHQHQQQQQQHLQSHEHHNLQHGGISNDEGKGGGSMGGGGGASQLMKWSCFCGENFEDHRQLVEHTRVDEHSVHT